MILTLKINLSGSIKNSTAYFSSKSKTVKNYEADSCDAAVVIESNAKDIDRTEQPNIAAPKKTHNKTTSQSARKGAMTDKMLKNHKVRQEEQGEAY